MSVHGDELQTQFGGGSWQTSFQVENTGEGAWILKVRFRVLDGGTKACNLAVGFEFESWSTQNYVVMPAAAYNGNRFQAVDKPTNSHRVECVEHPHAKMPVIISNQERSSVKPGPSRLEFRSSDLSTPAVGVQIPASKHAFLVLIPPGTNQGLTGINLEESLDRRRAELRFEAPCVRRGAVGRLKGDHAADFLMGDEVEFQFRVHLFAAPDVNALFKGFFAHREELGESITRHEIPFSAVWAVQEAKYNAQNWDEELGYFSVGMCESRAQDWQTAWVGGMNTVYALLCEGDDRTRCRALRTFDFLFRGGQSASGFFRGACHQGVWANPNQELQRYSADALLFILKEFLLLEARGERVETRWKEATNRCAEAFCRIWETQGQFGHRVDCETGVIAWGGTCSASTACGVLALAARYFCEPRFLAVAGAAAQHYHREFVSQGLTNGGPGDACNVLIQKVQLGFWNRSSRCGKKRARRSSSTLRAIQRTNALRGR